MSTLAALFVAAAVMLGVRRPGVPQTLHLRESAALIRSTRGKIEILNRAALQVRAGNAYGKTERSYDEVLEALDPHWRRRHLHDAETA